MTHRWGGNKECRAEEAVHLEKNIIIRNDDDNREMAVQKTTIRFFEAQ